jgi:hypothetical protein
MAIKCIETCLTFSGESAFHCLQRPKTEVNQGDDCLAPDSFAREETPDAWDPNNITPPEQVPGMRVIFSSMRKSLTLAI